MKEKWMRLWLDERTWKQRILLAVLPALLFAFNLFVFAPFDLFKGNKQFLWFRYMDLLPAMLILFGISFLVLAGIALLLRGLVFNLYVSGVYGAALGLYLQGNFLNGHLGSLDGKTVPWNNMTISMLVNVLVWLLILAVPVVLLYFSKSMWSRLVKITACLLVVIQAMNMAFIGFSAGAKEPEISDNNKFFISEGLTEVSEKKNAVVFILDMFDVAFMENLKPDIQDLLDQLDGFTYYPNTVGTHARTYPSVVQYFTGMMHNYDMTKGEYVDAAWKSSTFFPTLKENGFDIRVHSDSQYFPNENNGLIDNLVISKDATYAVKNPRGLVNKWTSFIGYKYAPLAFKPFFSLATSDFDIFKGNMKINGQEVEESAFSEEGVFDALAASKDTVTLNDKGGAFRYFHFRGAHWPFSGDENMRYDENSTMVKQVRGNLTFILNYIQNLKKLGVYDNTNIIITADHGHLNAGEMDSPPNPIFMMKPVGARGSYKTDQSPVWTNDLRKTILADMGLDASKEAGMDIRTLTPDTQRERYFYYPLIGVESQREERVMTYKVVGDANDMANWELVEDKPIEVSFYNV